MARILFCAWEHQTKVMKHGLLIKQHKIAAIEVTSSSISSLQIGRGFKKEK
jgi:hypothetical protein